jgi:hypothetical protein
MATKTQWIVIQLPIEQVIKLPQEQPYILINLFKGIKDEKVVERAQLDVNGISTILSRKLLAKKQDKPKTHLTFAIPSTFTFKVRETKFNETTRIYEDVREYPVSAVELATLV